MLFSIALSLPRDARFVGVLRNVAACIFDEIGAPQEAADDVRVALSEACANAVRHAVGSSEYSVGLSIDEDGCQIEVTDLGPGFDFPASLDGDDDDLPAVDSETGRGFMLMRALVDDLQFARQDDGTSVTLRKYWPEVGVALANEISSASGA